MLQNIWDTFNEFKNWEAITHSIFRNSKGGIRLKVWL
jgi:hypothetical protein